MLPAPQPRSRLANGKNPTLDDSILSLSLFLPPPTFSVYLFPRQRKCARACRWLVLRALSHPRFVFPICLFLLNRRYSIFDLYLVVYCRNLRKKILIFTLRRAYPRNRFTFLSTSHIRSRRHKRAPDCRARFRVTCPGTHANNRR